MVRVAKASTSKVTVWARRRTILACAVAFTAEEADKVLLTSMYLAIGSSLKALPSQLGQLTMYRALVQVRSLAASFHHTQLLLMAAAVRPDMCVCVQYFAPMHAC